MPAGIDTAGISIPAGTYLATFTYRAGRETGGKFVVDLLHDDTNPGQRTFLLGTPANGKVAITRVRPAVIEVRESR